MKAHLSSVRLAPKKANLIAKMVRGMGAEAALISLERTNKKGARIVEKLLKSAIANASHNDKQPTGNLIIKTIVVNQAQGLRRGVPMARGRVRPMIKFMSHITITLGYPEEDTKKKEKKAKGTSSPEAAPKTTAKKSTKKSPSSPASA